jgi:hypothetical protein
MARSYTCAELKLHSREKKPPVRMALALRSQTVLRPCLECLDRHYWQITTTSAKRVPEGVKVIALRKIWACEEVTIYYRVKDFNTISTTRTYLSKEVFFFFFNSMVLKSFMAFTIVLKSFTLYYNNDDIGKWNCHCLCEACKPLPQIKELLLIFRHGDQY